MRIRQRGPITVEAYMADCNAHYYAECTAFGGSGDFTTAPEIHQMFGEMVGACLADCWRGAGAPAEAAFAELGPGRGSLAADALRVLGLAGFRGEVHLVETSRRLREQQKERVPEATWHETIESLPSKPLLLIANEFLDALPVRQWVGDEQRLIAEDQGKLSFLSDGLVREDSPARNGAVAGLARHLANHGGAALLIDYGHERSAPGDTLQAVRGHRFADPLERPGEQDLTAHVDFQAVTEVAGACGAAVSRLVRQGEWLKRLGIEARAEALIRHNPGQAQSIGAALERLTAPSGMGELFKVIAIRSPQWPEPAGFEQ